MSSPKKLTLYLDVLSPFAYLAFHVVSNSPVFEECEIIYVPVSLAGILKATGNRPPSSVKNKVMWLRRERLQWASLFEVPMHEQMPPGFPQNMENTQQTLCMVKLIFPQRLVEVFAALYHTFFVLHKPVHTPEGLRSVLVTVLGEDDTNEVIIKGASDEAKQLLSANTNEMVVGGGFGLPWFVAANSQGEEASFWGFDHLALVTRHLSLRTTALRGEESWQALL